MTTFFLTDANGQKHSVNEQQLQALAAQGRITSETPLETDTGHQGFAGQIPGLNFGVAVQSPFAQTQQYSPPRQSTAYSQSNANSVGSSIISWLTDFAFRDLRLPIINLWACRIVYVICCIAAILWAVVMTFMGLASLGAHPGLLILVPLFFLGAVVFIFLARLLCEWYIIVFDWIVETTKAARKYNDE